MFLSVICPGGDFSSAHSEETECKHIERQTYPADSEFITGSIAQAKLFDILSAWRLYSVYCCFVIFQDRHRSLGAMTSKARLAPVFTKLVGSAFFHVSLQHVVDKAASFTESFQVSVAYDTINFAVSSCPCTSNIRSIVRTKASKLQYESRMMLVHDNESLQY